MPFSVGDLITFDRNIEYVKAHEPNRISDVTPKYIYLRDPITGSGTSLEIAVLRSLIRLGRISWTTITI